MALGLAMFAAWEFGLWHGRRLQVESGEVPVSKFEDASLALLGLLLGFTFSMAIVKHDQRRLMVVAGSNAIGDFYTCASLLKELLRTKLVEMLTAEKNRWANSPKVIHKSIDEHIRWLEKRLAGFDDELAGLVRGTPIWRERDELLRSVPGVGKVLSTTLLAHLPELGALNRKQIAARWPGWRPLTATAVACAAAVVSGAVAPRSGASFIWPWSPPFVPIQ